MLGDTLYRHTKDLKFKHMNWLLIAIFLTSIILDVIFSYYISKNIPCIKYIPKEYSDNLVKSSFSIYLVNSFIGIPLFSCIIFLLSYISIHYLKKIKVVNKYFI